MDTYICPNCGYVGKAAKGRKGNGALETILYLFFIVPGLIYTLWRSSNLESYCPQCKASNLIPLNTPGARAVYKQFHQEDLTEDKIAEYSQTSQETFSQKGWYIFLLVLAFGLLVIIIANIVRG